LGSNKSPRGVCSLLKWHGPGVMNAPGPFTFRGCDLTAEWLLAREHVRAQFPAAAPLIHRLSVSTRPDFQNPAHSGQHGGSLPVSGVVADKQCTCPASKFIWERYPSTPPAFARCIAAGEGCPPWLKRRRALSSILHGYGWQASSLRGE